MRLASPGPLVVLIAPAPGLPGCCQVVLVDDRGTTYQFIDDADRAEEVAAEGLGLFFERLCERLAAIEPPREAW